MKGFKQFGAGLLAVLGIMLVALPVSGASAAKLLTLTKEGVAVPVGAPADVGLVIFEGSCISFSEGTLSSDGVAKDVMKATSNAAQGCGEEGWSETGVITEAQFGGSGKATLKGSVEVTAPGPCTYKIKTLKGTFEVPGELYVSGTTTGKLNKKISAPTCATTLATGFQADGSWEPFGERFGEHL